MEYYRATKRNEILPFAATWMDQEGIMISEISQTKKDNYHMISFIREIQRTKQTNKNRNRLIDT